jgi:hypothetical protein
MDDLAIKVVLIAYDLSTGRDFHDFLARRIAYILSVSGHAFSYARLK